MAPAGIQSVNDPEVQSVLSNRDKPFHPSPIAWEDQVLYFLLPDRFSDDEETGYLDNEGWPVTGRSTPLYRPQDNGNAVTNATDSKAWLDAGAKFVGGNLKGVMSKLGYLKRLGITALWIGPLFKQVQKLETYHGYAVQNFLDIEPRFGTREDLRELVRVAHSLGIYVLLDIILNHSGNVFAYKNGSPVYTGSEYEVTGYYDSDRNPTIPMGTVNTKAFPNAWPEGAIWPAELQPMECFTRKGQIQHWDDSPEFLDGDFFDLKDLSIGHNDPDNFTSTPALRTLVSVYKYWIAYADLDGFRIDTVKHMGLGPTRYFATCIHEFTQSLDKEHFLLMGEIAGNNAFETVEVTGIDAALGIGGVQYELWNMPKGNTAPADYFSMFANAEYLGKADHTWFRDKVVTMIDDHDQIWFPDNRKERFSYAGGGTKLIVAAMALNLCTLGIPCIYYGSEQSFDGNGGNDNQGHSNDQYIREAMFGGGFGAFRSHNRHCFDESKDSYKGLTEVAAIRRRELALRRGRQFLREISGNGTDFGFPYKVGADKIKTVIAWSRIFDGVELLCAMNTDTDAAREVWVTVDSEINEDGASKICIFPASGQVVKVKKRSNGRAVVKLEVEPAGFVIYK
jgi:glycosidase